MSQEDEVTAFAVQLGIIIRQMNEAEMKYAWAMGGSLTIEEPELFSASCHLDAARNEIMEALRLMGKRTHNMMNGVQDV